MITVLNPAEDLDLLNAQCLELVDGYFGAWTRYVFGTPPNVTAVVFAVERDTQYHVFATFRDRPLAAAYVTTPGVRNPIRPGRFVVWYCSNTAAVTAHALHTLTPGEFRRTPITLPRRCRPPLTLPTVAPRIRRT